MTIEEAIRHCEEVAEIREAEVLKYNYCRGMPDVEKTVKNCKECAADHRQLAAWLTQLKELESKHWDECRQIAHYDNDVKLLKQIIQDRVAYVTDYVKAILEGIYSDSFEYNKGYCTALKDILGQIEEVTGGEDDDT